MNYYLLKYLLVYFFEWKSTIYSFKNASNYNAAQQSYTSVLTKTCFYYYKKYLAGYPIHLAYKLTLSH